MKLLRGSLILILLFPLTSNAFLEVGCNLFTTIYYFKPNGAFGNSVSYIHKGKDKSKWDIGGNGFYLTIAGNIYDWMKVGLFFGRAGLSEKIDSFNTYGNPEYQITHYDYGADLRLFPFRKYLFIRLGLLASSSTHQLLLNTGETHPLFKFKGKGYQAGFGIDTAFEKACFGYNCGFEFEYLVRKNWSSDMDIQDSSITYDTSIKTSYREVMLTLGFFWFY